jgi:galactitol-specific phosphotransferase system IIC component
MRHAISARILILILLFIAALAGPSVTTLAQDSVTALPPSARAADGWRRL